jgi:hypothetical protein
MVPTLPQGAQGSLYASTTVRSTTRVCVQHKAALEKGRHATKYDAALDVRFKPGVARRSTSAASESTLKPTEDRKPVLPAFCTAT